MNRLRVVLADDHPIVRAGCRALLEHDGIDVVAEATTGLEAVRLHALHSPDVMVLDFSMPEMNGLEAGREILRASPKAALVLLTMHLEDYHVAAALRLGIRGFVCKTQCPESLAHAVVEVAGGGTFLTPRIARMVVSAYVTGEQAPGDPLAPRERQVLRLLADGQSTKEIAATLSISVKTAESYRANLMDKLEIRHTAGLVRYAIRHGVIEA